MRKSASVIQESTTIMICAFNGKQSRDDKISRTVTRREMSNERALRVAKERDESTNLAALKKITKGSKARQVQSRAMR